MAKPSEEDGISRQHLTSTGSSETTTREESGDVVAGTDGTRVYVGREGVRIEAEAWQTSNCCGIPLGKKGSKGRSINFKDILWVATANSVLTITYARSINKAKVQPVTESFPISETDVKYVQSLADKILNQAYGRAQQRKRIKVVVNPFGGKGKALKFWANDIEPIFKAAQCEIDVVQTTHSKHAEEIGETLDIEAVDVVACCSGDGVPYEIWNGFGRRKNARAALAKVAVIQLPCGSGNAMSLNCNGTISPSKAALAAVKGVKTRMDLCSVTQGDKRTLSFCSQSLGIVAESDLGTENIRWLGSARFTVGFLTRLLGKTLYPADIALGIESDDKSAIEAEWKDVQSRPPPEYTDVPATYGESDVGEGLPPLRYGTISSPLPAGWEMKPFPNLGNFYAGNFPFMAEDLNFFPFARIADGKLDLITIRGDVSTAAGIRMLLAVGEAKLWQNEIVNYRKVTGFRIIPRQTKGYISIDGERYPFEGFQVEVHQGLGCTLTPAGREVLPE